MRRTITVAWTVAVLAAPTGADAAVTLQPDHIPAGGASRLDLRVSNDATYTSMVAVRVRLPRGLDLVSTEAIPGWKATIVTSRRGGPETVRWTGDGRLGTIGPVQFKDFGVSVTAPNTPGVSVPLDVLETLADDETVHWVGPGYDGYPAPLLKLTGAAGAGAAAPAVTTTPTSPTRSVASVKAGSAGGDEGAPTWLALLALAVGALGLLAGIGGLAAARRRPARL